MVTIENLKSFSAKYFSHYKLYIKYASPSSDIEESKEQLTLKAGVCSHRKLHVYFTFTLSSLNTSQCGLPSESSKSINPVNILNKF